MALYTFAQPDIVVEKIPVAFDVYLVFATLELIVPVFIILEQMNNRPIEADDYDIDIASW